jgi:uncharacterized membrane protein
LLYLKDLKYEIKGINMGLTQAGKRYLELKRKTGKSKLNLNTETYKTSALLKIGLFERLFYEPIYKIITLRVIMLLCSRFVLGNWKTAIILTIVTTVLYYLHELVWIKIRNK